MITREEGKQRFALTFLLTICVFVVIFITAVISFGVVMALVAIKNIPIIPSGEITPMVALISMLIISVVIGVVMSAIMSKLMAAQVNKLIDHMNQLASGDFKTRLDYGKPLNNHPTIREVTESFNRMAEELEHTEMLRGDFVNNFSHEFKTPIVSISGFAKLLKKGNLSKEQRDEYLDIIEEESLRLSDMATNVLDMTKIENQSILTDVSTYNLSEQLRSCVLLLEKRWDKKHLEISLEFEEYTIKGCEELLKHVWINLLDNAIKYSPEYGTVVLKVCEEEKYLKVTVANTGEPIPPDKMEKIFDKFYQADESHASPGNGIGLSIVKSVVTLHGGDVSVTCKNGITAFNVRLPIE